MLSCEFTWDVILTFVGFIFSLLAAAFAVFGFASGWPCCTGLGSQAGSVLTHVLWSSVIGYMLIVPFNAMAAYVVCLSFFESVPFKLRLFEGMTTSGGLRTLQLITQFCFFLCLAGSQLLLAWLCGVSLLGHICSNPTLIAPAQMLVVAMGNSPADLFDSFFSPADPATGFTITLRQVLQDLNLISYCGSLGTASRPMWYIWIGSSLLVVSQALLSVALRGEKQRVHVHELVEAEIGLGHMAGEAIDGLLHNPAAVSSVGGVIGGPLGAAAGGVASALWQGTHKGR
eukprot:TRINITY_DN103068_c0_g1_i1.p1 TRINITY_DN103068_c0_g1~~TRINITY_DN103068_c0_g1_i1.p1  ORF type:complete len:286 (-),score=41.83 TRINITY_DN103068_c0_g1_i1:36-893(-)